MISRVLGLLSPALVSLAWGTATLLVSAAAVAQVPGISPVQGFVTDADGIPLDGMHRVSVTLYDAPEDGRALFREDHETRIEQGALQVLLGTNVVLDPQLFREQRDIWVGVTIDDDEELAPRLRLATVPYAAASAWAGTADTAATAGRAVTAGAADRATTAGAADRATTAGSADRAALATNADVAGRAILADFATRAGTADEALRASAANAVPFSGITGLPPGLADGDNDTTYSAGQGLLLAGTTFSADTNTLQRRVTTVCGPGTALVSIGADGTATCAAAGGSAPTYSAGTGLLLAGTTFSIDPNQVQRRVGACGAGTAIQSVSTDGVVTCETIPTAPTYVAGVGIVIDGSTIRADVTSRRGFADPSGSEFSAQAAHWLGIRFRTHNSQPSGRLEVSLDNGTSWGTVCDDWFDDNAARVTCREMGYTSGTMMPFDSFPGATSAILLDDIRCTATSMSLLDCGVRQLRQHNCSHSEDVSVACTP